MRDCDVLIVGAGPAGAAAALALQGSRRTVLIDRRRAPWRKPCDGVLTPMSRRALAGLGIDPVRDLDAREIDTLRVLDFDHSRESVTRLSGHWIVDRPALDHALQQRVAAQANTEFFDRTAAEGWQPHGDGFTVRLRKGSERPFIRTRFLVDASGAPGALRRAARNPLPCVLAAQHWYAAEGGSIRFDWIFDRAATPFYLWAIHNGHALALGVVVPLGRAREASSAIENRLKPALGIRGRPCRIETAPMAMPVGRDDFWFGSGPLLAAGETAGLINAGTGEGISFGLRSGIACGLAVAGAPDAAAASRIYRELVAPLAHECDLKASHARRLFDTVSRGELSGEELLVPVSRNRLPERAAAGPPRT